MALKIVTELARLLLGPLENAPTDRVVAINRFRIVSASSRAATEPLDRCGAGKEDRQTTGGRWTTFTSAGGLL